MEIVGCFFEHDGKFLLLLRHAHKPNGGTWGLPAGKVSPGESDDAAMLRELYEETGYSADSKELERLGSFTFGNSQDAYNFTAYRLKLGTRHQPMLESQAHADCKWVTAEECNAMRSLIPDFHELLRLVKYVQ
jgi:8-oxo-dGTP pyrophosphatase MutT (NUDIX family)